MSSLVGIGVADTVVLTLAVATGPTKRFQRPSTLIVNADVKAVGLATAVPLHDVVLAGVGIMVVGRGVVEFSAVANPARTKDERMESFMVAFRLLG
jgi:hypothetical protein